MVKNSWPKSCSDIYTSEGPRQKKMQPKKKVDNVQDIEMLEIGRCEGNREGCNCGCNGLAQGTT